TEILLHVGDRGGERRGSAFGGIGAPSDQAFDRSRESGGRALGRRDRGKIARLRRRYRAPGGRKIPRSDAHPIIGAAAPGEAVDAERRVMSEPGGVMTPPSIEIGLVRVDNSEAARTSPDCESGCRETGTEVVPFRISGKNIDIGEALRTRVNARIAEAM